MGKWFVLMNESRQSRKIYLDSKELSDLREFFQKERDKALNVWRDPKEPYTIIAKLDNGAIRVWDEQTLVYSDYRAGKRVSVGDYGLDGAASRYYEAHPAPKPWLNVKVGDCWIVQETAAAEEKPALKTELGWVYLTGETPFLDEKYWHNARR